MGNLEIQTIQFSWDQGIKALSGGMVAKALSISLKQERELLSRMARKNLLYRLYRGVYLVPPGLPSANGWSPGEYAALYEFMRAKKAQYQISGPSAFYFWGFIDQIPNLTYVFNDRVSGNRILGGGNMVFIKVAQSKLGAIYSYKMPDGTPVTYSNKARTVVDALNYWRRFNGIPRAYFWLKKELRENPAFVDELIEATLRFGNQGTISRIGYLLDKMDFTQKSLNLIKVRRSSRAPVALIPFLPRRGAIEKTWMVILNEHERNPNRLQAS